VKKVGLFIVIIRVTAGTFCHADDINIEEFIKSASINYKTSFTIDTTLDRWNRVLDNPLLIGRLWERYGFSPAYKVSINGSFCQVIDPKGIKGNLFLIQSSNTKRIFYGIGRMKNWLIPVSLKGKALFILQYTFSNNKTSVTLDIYGEGGDNLITKLLLKAISPILMIHINNRVTYNLRDLKIIISDIDHNPDKIRNMLGDEVLHDFILLSN